MDKKGKRNEIEHRCDYKTPSSLQSNFHVIYHILFPCRVNTCLNYDLCSKPHPFFYLTGPILHLQLNTHRSYFFLHSILPTFCDLWAKIEPGTLLFFATKRKGLRAESIRHFEFQTSGLCAKKEPQLTAAARIKDRIRAYLQNGESERRFAITFGISSNT